MAVGEHVDMGVGHALPVERPRGLGEATVGEAALLHQEPEGISEWLVAGPAHRSPRLLGLRLALSSG